MDPASGKLITTIQVSPTDFGQTDSPDKFIESKVYSRRGISMEELDNLEKRLYILYNILFEAWAINSSSSDNDKFKDEAHEFLRVFEKISELPLHIYYNVLGHDWFGWLRKLAQ